MTLFEQNSKLRVAVLAGGDSPEREVSLRSGSGVAAALESAGHEALLFDPAQRPLDDLPARGVDACFVALHGGAGEDGRVQSDLARLGLPYTGSSAEACRLAMSKTASKKRFSANGVPTLPYEVFSQHGTRAAIAARAADLGYPLVIKPDDGGSSVGVTIVAAPEQLPPALAEARRHAAVVLAEPLVRGREFTVAVLDDVALPVIEIVTPEPVFSYEAKYHSSLTDYHFDFQLNDALAAEIRHSAIGASRALGTSGLVRVDVMLSHERRVWVLELNAIPGMTPRSLAPLAAARAGIAMPALCDMLVRRCLAPTGVL